MRDDIVSRVWRASLGAGIALGLSGCAGFSGQAQAPVTPFAASAEQLVVTRPAATLARTLPAAAPDSGVKSKNEPLSPKGGKLTLPALPSFKGSFGYPSNNAPSGAQADLSASLTNAFNAPTPSGADIVYFLQATLQAKALFITFNSTGKEKVKVGGSLLNPADSYTLYVYVPALGNQPVATISVGQPNSKHQLIFDSPFNGETLPVGTAVVLELGQS